VVKQIFDFNLIVLLIKIKEILSLDQEIKKKNKKLKASLSLVID